MVDVSKLMVSVERLIPYSKLLQREKIAIASTTDNEELLEAIATDKSRKVKQTLMERSKEIPDNVLGENLLKDDDAYIREMARRRIVDEKLNSIWYKEYGGINKVLIFLCEFFSPSFVMNLGNPQNKKLAIAAIYLYDIKYGFFKNRDGSPVFIFVPPFYSHTIRTTIGMNPFLAKRVAHSKYEPWNGELWKIIDKLSNYRYVPEELDIALKENKLSEEEKANVEILKQWKNLTMPYKTGNHWVYVLAKTLFNLGEVTAIESEENKKVVRYRITIEESFKLIEEAEAVLFEMYKTSACTSYFNSEF